MVFGFLAAWTGGCAGWVGDSGFVGCPEVPGREVPLDEPVKSLDLAVQDLPMYAASPVRVGLRYEQTDDETGLSMRIEPLSAMVRAAQSPVLGPERERRCEEVVTDYALELFSDDGVFEWASEGNLVVEAPEDAAFLSVAAPVEANQGQADELLDAVLGELREAQPGLQGLRPDSYALALDLTERAPSGSLTLVVEHEPVRSSDPEAPLRTRTEWVIGTF